MTSLSTPKNWDVPTLPDPLPDPETKPEDIITVNIQGKDYFFSPDHVKKYPKLLDPDAKFLLGFDSVLPLIYGYSVSSIEEDLLENNAKKTVFLAAVEFLDITLPEAAILHLSKSLREEVERIHQYIRKKVGNKGDDKLRFVNRRKPRELAAKFDAVFRQHKAEVTPDIVLTYLEYVDPAFRDEIVVLDFKTRNLIMPLIRAFREKFL